MMLNKDQVTRVLRLKTAERRKIVAEYEAILQEIGGTRIKSYDWDLIGATASRAVDYRLPDGRIVGLAMCGKVCVEDAASTAYGFLPSKFSDQETGCWKL